jgi:hypothetical protein
MSHMPVLTSQACSDVTHACPDVTHACPDVTHTCPDVTLLLEVGIVLDLALLLVDDVAAGDCRVGALLVLVRGAHLQNTNIVLRKFTF